MMTASKKTLNRVEGLGLILILISFFMQLMQNDLEGSKHESEYYHLNEKLDNMWTIIEKQYSENHPDEGVSMAINFKFYDENWKIYSEQRKEMESWEDAINIFSKISIVIFITGTIISIIPKFIEEK